MLDRKTIDCDFCVIGGGISGMCAAISIVRKKLAYEDKPNYVDSLISELDSSNSSPIVDDAIDEAIGSFKLKVSYTISENTLTFTFEVDGCPSFLTGASSSNSFDLTYTPLLGATYNIVK